MEDNSIKIQDYSVIQKANERNRAYSILFIIIPCRPKRNKWLKDKRISIQLGLKISFYNTPMSPAIQYNPKRNRTTIKNSKFKIMDSHNNPNSTCNSRTKTNHKRKKQEHNNKEQSNSNTIQTNSFHNSLFPCTIHQQKTNKNSTHAWANASRKWISWSI